MGQPGTFAHDNIIDHQQVQRTESFFIGLGVWIGPQGVAGRNQHGAQALGVVV